MTRCTLPVFFSKMKKSLFPIKAILVGCESPLTTVLTERFGSVIDGPTAGELMVVCRLTELSARLGSFSVAVTLAVLVKTPAACGTTAILTIANAPRTNEPRLQVIVVVPAHKPCVGVTEVKLIPEGILSVTTILVAGEGPLLVTVTW